VTEQSKDNPVFYVQYASARIHSVMRKAVEAGVDVSDLAHADLSLATHPGELAMAAKLAEWPRLVEIAAKGHEPHRIAFYLYDLASELHGLWNRGSDDASLRFLQVDNIPATQAKIALIKSVSVVISHGLGILGVTPAEEMR
jgi:arginyl-tRNA synthetase